MKIHLLVRQDEKVSHLSFPVPSFNEYFSNCGNELGMQQQCKITIAIGLNAQTLKPNQCDWGVVHLICQHRQPGETLNALATVVVSYSNVYGLD